MENLAQNIQGRSVAVDKSFTVLRFDLSDGGSRNILKGPSKVAFSFLSFWVSAVSDDQFNAKIYVNPEVDQGDGLTVKSNMSVNFESHQKGAVLEFQPQYGKWIEITFAHNTRMDSGSIALSINGEVALKPSGSYSITTVTPSYMVPLRILNAVDYKRDVKVYNSGSDMILIGREVDCVSYSLENLIDVWPGETLEINNKAEYWALGSNLSTMRIIEEVL